IGRRFGELHAVRLDTGQATPALDLLIAATALEHNHTLATHNVRDFKDVPGLDVVDWLDP
ncbi:MAG: type II toxin-antitoxin system VapC family toxin, partial [Pirellulales bacterium]|nr:type II toxin-antitoxin system VapC family toxin [Pirellulales bacterium]